MKQFVVLFCLMVISVDLFANDTLIFKGINPHITVKNMGGDYIRKVIPTTDSGFLALDYNGDNLIAKGYYSDTDFIIKIYEHSFYNTSKGFLQEIKSYDSVGDLNLHAELNKNGDTIWRQNFLHDAVVGYKIFGENESDRTIFFSMQKPAVFPGGVAAWKKYIATNMRYPKDAVRRRISGVVVVEFTVSKEGKISDPKIIESAGALLDAEAIRLIKTSPTWIPAEDNGTAINFIQTRPVVFKL